MGMGNGYSGEAGYRQWRSPEPRCVFLLVHGLGAHSGRWEAMADFFLKKGISSYAAELRSFDSTGKADRRADDFAIYRDKILRVYDIAAKDNPAKKIFLIGESMGALISFLLCVDRPGLFSGLVCISPAFATRNKVSVPDCIRMLAPLLYNPGKLFPLPFDSSMCTRDIDYKNKMDQDSREYRTASSKLIFEILLAQLRAGSIGKKITTPVLFLSAGEDKIVDTKAATGIFNSMMIKDKKLIEYPGMYHALSIDLGKESVFEDISRWIMPRITPKVAP